MPGPVTRADVANLAIEGADLGAATSIETFLAAVPPGPLAVST
jgi:hypothetical protein